MINPRIEDRQSRPDNTIQATLSPSLNNGDLNPAALLQSLPALERDIRTSRDLILSLLDHLEEQLAMLTKWQGALAMQRDPVSLLTVSPSAADAMIRIYCLGQFRIYWHDRMASLHNSAKSTMIAKFLAVAQHKPVQREVLLEVLWPGIHPTTANNRLKVAIHNLRSFLAILGGKLGSRACILFHDGCYEFNPKLSLWIDVEVFDRYWQTGMRLAKMGRISEAITCYANAEQLYQGDFLEEDRYEEWTLLQREELRNTYLTILDKLSWHWFETGQTDSAIEGWRKILAKDPWREDVYRHLMLSLARSGNRGLALRWYDTCTQVLRDELGIKPEPETIALFERIRSCEDMSGKEGSALLLA